MNDFLNNLYKDGLEKQAGADLQAFLKTLSVDELAELAGVKLAVAGPTEPGEPTGGSAAAAKVTQQSVPKKTTPPEEPKVNAQTPGTTADRVTSNCKCPPGCRCTQCEVCLHQGGEKRAHAEFISMAMHAVADAPFAMRRAAAKLAARG